MANKKKNASANPNLDTVKDVFRKNRHITNRIQKKTVFEATDLSEKYYARRVKAVMHLLPEMKKRYAAKYPEMDMVSEFAEAASFPSITYDIIDWRMDVCLGAAVWLLDRIWEQEKMQQLCDLLLRIAKSFAFVAEAFSDFLTLFCGGRGHDSVVVELLGRRSV